jgi:lipid II:glycine glycyltransferase (peptidoglycan interpeptide bridge formation enzyme)
MEIKYLSDKEKNLHNNLNQGSLLQKWEWGDFKKSNSWKPLRIGVLENEKILYSHQLLIKKLPLNFSIIYSPFINIPDRKIFEFFIKEIEKIAQNNNSIFWRVEPLEKKSQEKISILEKLSFIKGFEELQPNHTLAIDLKESEESILKQMKQKGRYNIRLAQKKEVEVREINNENDFQAYQKIHEETSKRDKISARPFSYLKNLYTFLKKNNLGTAFIAYYHDKPISGGIISIADKRATYMYGASSNIYRNIMAPYLLQWEAIKHSKEKGCLLYDFYGIAPSDNKKHKWHGITRFKKQFGGNEIELLGSYDFVFKKFWYNSFKIIERLRKFFL